VFHPVPGYAIRVERVANAARLADERIALTDLTTAASDDRD